MHVPSGDAVLKQAYITIQISIYCFLQHTKLYVYDCTLTFVSLQDFSMECGICYAYRLNDLIPDKACDDSRCGQPFHSLCLYEVIIQTILF